MYEDLKEARKNFYIMVFAAVLFGALCIYNFFRTDYYTGEVYNMNSIIESSDVPVEDSRFKQREWYKLNISVAYGPFDYYTTGRSHTKYYRYLVLLEDNSIIAVQTKEHEQATDIVDFIASEYRKNDCITVKGDVEGYLRSIGSSESLYNQYIQELKDKNLLNDSAIVRSLLLDTSHYKVEKTVGYMLACFGFFCLMVLGAYSYHKDCKELEEQIKNL